MTVPALLCAVAAIVQQSPRLPDTTTIVIAATTDVHGRATAWDYERDRAAPLGLVRVATVMDSLRRAHPDHLVIVDAGDLLQGNSLAWVAAGNAAAGLNPMILAMNRIGYDVATPGNHEFNYPLPLLDSLLRGRRFGYVSSNIVRLTNHVTAYPADTTLVRAGVRIGITGATTPGVLVWDGPHIADRLTLLPVAQAVPPVTRRLRSRGADVIVLVAHAGLDGPSSYAADAAPPEDDVAAALAAAGDIDVAVIGHTHREIADSTVGTTLVVQPKNWAQSVAVAEVHLERTAGRWRVTGRRGRIIPLADVPPDPGLVRALAGWHDLTRRRTAEPLGRSADAMPARQARLEDTPLIDFVNAVMRSHAGADLSATAAFDLNSGWPAGDVTIRDIFGVYPYENTLKAVRITGAQLRAYLEQTARYYTGMGPDGPVVNPAMPGYNFDLVSGADYELDLSRPVGQRVAQLLVQGRDVRDDDSFTIALNNYRAQGGGGYTMLANAPVVYDRGEDIRELLSAELRAKGTIHTADYFVPSWRIRSLGADTATVTTPTGRTDSIVLRVLATNDLHGALESKVAPWSGGRPVGGMATIAGMMDRLTAECGCPTVRLDGGDAMQGTAPSNLTYGRAMVETLNAMHLSAAAIGNHEFDWSVDTLRARIAQASFPWLAANIRMRATRQRPAWARPSAVIRAGSLRIAVVGYATPGTTTSSNPVFVAPLGFLGAPSLDSAIAAARSQHPDFVIVVAHEGAFCDRDAECRGGVVELAQALQHKPDLIVSGHTHSLVNTVVNGIPIVQARSSGTALGIVDFVRVGARRAVHVRVETVWADREQPDSAVAVVVRRSLDAVRQLTERRIAVLAQALPRDGDQYALADLVADALREVAHADVALVNNTGIRAPLPEGPVTWGQLYEVLPFGNLVVRIPVTGALLKDVLRHGLSGEARASVSGLTVTLNRGAPPDQRLASVTLADGRPVDDEAVYTLATFDFLASGGSGYTMLHERPATSTGVDELDAFIAFLGRQPQPVRIPQPYPTRIRER